MVIRGVSIDHIRDYTYHSIPIRRRGVFEGDQYHAIFSILDAKYRKLHADMRDVYVQKQRKRYSTLSKIEKAYATYIWTVFKPRRF
jgi:hypothetical protein